MTCALAEAVKNINTAAVSKRTCLTADNKFI